MTTLGDQASVLITTRDAYDAMVRFLIEYWKRGGESSEDLAILLGNVQRRSDTDYLSADPAQWEDWLDAVASVRPPPPWN